MIIVCQDKKTIINFESITRVSIVPLVEKMYKYLIAINGCLDLGYYETEERAKEVLQEITNTFSAVALNGTHDEIDLILKAKSMARYEMPKE